MANTKLFSILVCQSKVQYHSFVAAKNALREIGKGKRIGNKQKYVGTIEVYKCPICGLYHHGHNGDRRRHVKHVVQEEE